MIKKILKISGISFLVLLVILIVLPFIFKNKILQYVKDEINNNLNAKVDFKDYDIGIFKTFPNLYVELNDLSVVGIDEFDKDTLTYLPSFTASLDLFSLFEDQIKIKSIILDKPLINLIVLKNGKANWDITKASTDTTETTDTTTSHFSLALKKFEINNAKITYNDASLDMKFIAEQLNFKLKGDLTDERTTLNTTTTIDSTTLFYEGIPYLKKAKINFDGIIDADLVNYIYTFSKNKLSINDFNILLDGKIAMPADDIDIDLKYASEKNDFKTLLSLIPAIYLKDFPNVSASGTIKFNGIVKGIYNEKSMPGFNLTLVVDKGSFKYASLPAAVNNIFVDLFIDNKDGNTDHTLINLRKFHMNVAGNPIDASLFVSTPVSNPALKGMIKGKLDLNQVQQFYPLDNTRISGLIDLDVIYETTMSLIESEKYDEIKALGHIIFKNVEYVSTDVNQTVLIPDLQTEITPKYFDLKNLQMKIGSSDLNLKGKIENFMQYLFKDDLLKGYFSLTSNILNVNQFLSSEESTSTTASTPDTSSLEAPEIPKNIDFTFTASINQLLYDNLELLNTRGNIQLKEGILDLQNLSFNTLDGKFVLTAKYENTQLLPLINMSLDIKDLNIKKAYEAFNTVKQLAPIASKCDGKISMNLAMQMNMTQKLDPMLNTLDATGSFSSKSITFENTDLGKKISEFFKNKTYETFNVKDISAKFKIEKGNITIEPIKTNIGNIPTEFSGSQNLDQHLNYTLLMKVPKKVLGTQANEILNEWMGLANKNGINVKTPDEIPVLGIITGTLTKPEIKLNLKDMAQSTAETIKETITQKVTEEIDKAKEEAIRKAQEQADKLYKEAEQKANQIIQAAESSAKQIVDVAHQTAEQVRKEGYDKAAQIEKEAQGKGPIAQKLAKESADKIRKETDKKANDIIQKAQEESQNKVNQARIEADKIKAQAKEQGNKLIEQAKK